MMNIAAESEAVKFAHTWILTPLGQWGPLLMIAISGWLLWREFIKENFAYYFAVGIVVNALLNAVLKGIVQAPRPPDMQLADGVFRRKVAAILWTRHGLPWEIFGWPSGHAQAVAYVWTFMWGVLWSSGHRPGWGILALYAVIGAAVLWERWLDDWHTIAQIAAGLVVGAGVGFGAWWVVGQKVKGVMRDRPDDNAILMRRLGIGFL